MALTVAKRDDGLFQLGVGPGVGQRVTLTPDNNYPAGGYAVSGSQAGLGSAGGPASNGLHGILWEGGNTASVGYVPFYNQQTGKFQILVTGTAAGDPLNDATATTDFSALVFYAIFEGVSE